MDSGLVAMVAGNLMGGSHPDMIHEVHAARYVKMAIAIVQEAEKQVDALPAPAPVPVPPAA